MNKKNKKILFGLAAFVVVVGGVVALSAFEAHIINVTAHIENALSVDTKEIAFGTVFPQETLYEDFTVSLSQSFMEEPTADDVSYVIKQKPKPGYDNVLCPFLSKMDADPEDNNDRSHPSYYVEDREGDYCRQPTRIDNELVFGPYGWAGWSCPAGMVVVGGGVVGTPSIEFQGPAKPGEPMYPVYPHYTYTPPEEGWVVQNDNDQETIAYYVLCDAGPAAGMLTKDGGDTTDLWTVDLKVPPVKGYVGQDWPAGCPTVPTNDVDYGCDLWIEVTGISRRLPLQ